jgi:UDP-N-acetylmuramoyl-L-alanyl-D-glutamate--2,6-diaminopimelate ligase
MRGLIASLLSGNPAKNMIVIGVTGTKGKTTVTNLIASGLQSAGKKVAMISTANMMIDGVVTLNEKKMTSLDPFEMWNFLNKAKKA